jgi:hypothetical protein
MDVTSIYAVRNSPRAPLSEDIHNIIAKLKITFKPSYRRPTYAQPKRASNAEPSNWRETALVDVVRKVREKDDVDYGEVNSAINKLTKQTYAKLMGQIIERLSKRDEMFRLRVTTLLFDRGIRQNFYASIMADAYADILKAHPEANDDLMSQIKMFDKLYDVSNVTILPASSDPGFDAAVIEWTKQKEKKRGFAVYVGELYVRDLLTTDTMSEFVETVADELRDSVTAPKTSAKEEHVDCLVRFLFAIYAKVPAAKTIAKNLLNMSRDGMPNLNTKSRFKLEDIVR